MPRIHLGVYLTSGQEASNTVRWALEVLPTQHTTKGLLLIIWKIRLATERTLQVEGERDEFRS